MRTRFDALVFCLALTACGASVEVEPSDAGPLCEVAESTVCQKGVAALCKAGGNPGPLWTLVGTDETSETTWCQEQ